MLTVACVWIKSETYPDQSWVEKLYQMVYNNLNRDFLFVVITKELFKNRNHNVDCPLVIQHPTISIPDGWPLWWYKLNLFNLSGGRILYLDLDTVIMGSLDELVNYPSDFVMAPTNGVPTKNHDFNSSVMVWNSNSEQVRMIKESLPKNYYKLFPGDQQYISSLKMKIDAFPYQWIHKYLPGKGPYIPPSTTKVVLMIQGGKNQVLLDNGHNWIGDYWK